MGTSQSGTRAGKTAAEAELTGDGKTQLTEGGAELERYFEEQEITLRRDREFNVVKQSDLEGDLLPDSWESAIAAMESIGATISRADEDLADDYPVIDKERLINRPFMALTWSISKPANESYGTPYIVVRGILRGGKRFRFTDGSTGICEQLIKLTEQRIKSGFAVPNAGLICPNGLRKSEYTYRDTDKDGNPVDAPASTFYIDNQPSDGDDD